MTTRRLRMKVSAAAAVALGLTLRLWFIHSAARIAGDTLIYGDIARNWMEHGVYGFSQSAAGLLPTLIRLPGYPIFLIGCFHLFGVEHFHAVMYVQAVIDLLTCLILSALTDRLFGRRAAIATLWLGALCPFTASYVAAPLTETLSLTCIALAFYGLERWRLAGARWSGWLWTIAAALAYAVLLRPEQGMLAVAVVPAMVWIALHPVGGISALRGWSGWLRALPVIAAALCVVLPLVPWTVRNWRTFHVIQPLAPRSATDSGERVPVGFQRWYRTWAIDFASTEDVYWNYDGAAVEIGDLPTRAFDSDEQYARTEALLEEYNETDNATAALDARFAELARERIAANPIRYYVALPVARLLNMVLRPRTEMFPVPLEWWRWKEHPRKTAFAALYAVLNLGYFVLGFLGLWTWKRNGWGGDPAVAWSMIGFVALRCAVLLALDNSEPRYTLELFPVLMVWGGIMFSADWRCRVPPRFS